MADFAKCRECQCEIMWCRSSTTGNLMPVDAEPSMDGNIVIGGNGEIIVLSVEKAAEHKGLKHKSHFATCTNPKRFRKKAE